MYSVFFTKQAQKDIPKLKAAHLDAKVKQLIEICKEPTLEESIFNIVWCIPYWNHKKLLKSFRYGPTTSSKSINSQPTPLFSRGSFYDKNI